MSDEKLSKEFLPQNYQLKDFLKTRYNEGASKEKTQKLSEDFMRFRDDIHLVLRMVYFDKYKNKKGQKRVRRGKHQKLDPSWKNELNDDEKGQKGRSPAGQ